jgi:hypothetical protein
MVLALLCISLLIILASDRLDISPIRRDVSPHLFSLESWVTVNALDKWIHRFQAAIPGRSSPKNQDGLLIQKYFEVRDEISSLTDARDQFTLDDPRWIALNQTILDHQAYVDQSRNDVEELIENTLSSVLLEQGLKRGVGPVQTLLPPVDIRFVKTPALLTISPRDRIVLRETILLRGDMPVSLIEQLENKLRTRHNISALIVPISGLAAYPAMVADHRNLERTLELTAHEWLHQYWFFHPLGFNYFSNLEMTTLNETAADIAGRELGQITLDRLLFEPKSSDKQPLKPNSLDFRDTMQETRSTVDTLLASGRVTDAEEYMKTQQEKFVAHGYRIRKLNQAYFAFHGTYAQSAASTSSIGEQLEYIRYRSESVGEFVKIVANFGSHSEFEIYLDRD